MLSRAIRRHRADELEHLVVELKAPRVKLGSDETVQIEKYAFAVSKDERFRSIKTRWSFWIISDDFNDYVEHRISSDKSMQGKIFEDGDVCIFVKTWSQVIEENKARLQFFQEKLEHQVDQGNALKYLREKHEKILSSVVTDDIIEEFTEEAAE